MPADATPSAMRPAFSNSVSARFMVVPDIRTACDRLLRSRVGMVQRSRGRTELQSRAGCATRYSLVSPGFSSRYRSRLVRPVSRNRAGVPVSGGERTVVHRHNLPDTQHSAATAACSGPIVRVTNGQERDRGPVHLADQFHVAKPPTCRPHSRPSCRLRGQ